MSKPDNCPDNIYEIMRHCWELLSDKRISYVSILDILHHYLEEEQNQQELANKKSSLKSGLKRIFQKNASKSCSRPLGDAPNLDLICPKLIEKYHEDTPECDDDFTFYKVSVENEVKIHKIPLANLQILGFKTIGSTNHGTCHEGILTKDFSSDQSIPVTVKTLKASNVSLAEFLSEAKTICNFNHKNIIKFIGVSLESHPVCTVLERFYEKDSLQFTLQANQQEADPFNFTLANCIQIASDIAEACLYLQYQRVIHTFIGACNCYLFGNQPSGDIFTTKLGGFENAVTLSIQDDHYMIPEDIELSYPVKWTAPEVFSESKYSFESDVWSYGIMLWELFSAGEVPYPKMSDTQTKGFVVEGNRLSKPSKCPQKIYFSVMKACWLKSPERIKFDKIVKTLRECIANVSELELSILSEREPSLPPPPELISASESSIPSNNSSYDKYEELDQQKRSKNETKDIQSRNENHIQDTQSSSNNIVLGSDSEILEEMGLAAAEGLLFFGDNTIQETEDTSNKDNNSDDFDEIFEEMSMAASKGLLFSGNERNESIQENDTDTEEVAAVTSSDSNQVTTIVKDDNTSDNTAWNQPYEELHSAELCTVKKKQISARLALAKNHKARGIIFIVGVFGADGTEIDVENVETTFKNLNFTTYVVQDPPAEEISALIHAASDVQLYPYKYEYVAFYFAGHGGRDEEGRMFIVGLQKDDEKKEILYVDDHIINPLKCLHERKLSRLFFFDCCQSKGEGMAYRSDAYVRKKPKPHPGQIIAYATNDGEKSWGDRENGGIWTYHLCKNIRELDEPITTILSKTYDDVVEARESFQQPLVVASLGMRKLKTGSVELHAASSVTTESTDSLLCENADHPLLAADASLEKCMDNRKPSNMDGSKSLSPISVQAVCNALNKYSSSWNDFACELEVDDEYRDTLENNDSLSDEEKLERIITQWIQNRTCEVSWDKIVAVNKELDLETDDLEKASTICLMKPDDWREVFNCLKRKASCWSDLAQELQISDSFRDELEQSTVCNDRRKLEKVIKEWLDESQGYEPTWEKMIRAVKELELMTEEVHKLENAAHKEPAV